MERFRGDEVVRVRGVAVPLKKMALAYARKYRSTKPPIVDFSIEQAKREDDLKFLGQLGNAALKKEFLPKQLPLAQFLVEYWCGERGSYGQLDASRAAVRKLGIFVVPPLCFFAPKALAKFAQKALNLSDKQTSQNVIAQWLRRLQLRRIEPYLIRDVKSRDDGVVFQA
jgi:hypothetical protein